MRPVGTGAQDQTVQVKNVKQSLVHINLQIPAISCGPPPMISNGSSGTPTSMMFEGSVTYSCENGYELSGSAMVTCEASGNWSTLPSCRGKFITIMPLTISHADTNDHV